MQGHPHPQHVHSHQHPGGRGNLSIQPPVHSAPGPIIKPPPVTTRELTGPLFAIDVECVATGKEHDARAVARIAMVNEAGETVFDEYVKPKENVVSCLTALTGVEPSHLEDADDLPTVMTRLREKLPKDSVIVGQGISSDIKWLKLEEGADFDKSFDIATLFRTPDPRSSRDLTAGAWTPARRRCWPCRSRGSLPQRTS